MKYECYIIHNYVNAKKYIGITTRSIRKRWLTHLSTCSRGNKISALYSAMRKYGADNFYIEHIASSFSFSDLLETERQLISQYNSVSPYGYNLTHGGEGMLGFKFSSEAIQKMSKSHLGFKPKRESIEKTRIAITGKKKTLEHNKKVSDGIKKVWNSMTLEERKEIGKKIRNGMQKKLNDEKVSVIRLGIISGDRNRKISEDLGIEYSLVRNIRNGDTWKDVPPYGFSEGILYGGL